MQDLELYINHFIETVTLEMILKFFVVYFFVIWISVIIWVVRDITNRSDSLILQILSVLIVFILSPLGVFVYLLIRPSHTLFEKYYDEIEENLDDLSCSINKRFGVEEKTLLRCPKCHYHIEDDYQFCPKCRTELVKKCFHCKKNINMAWKNCPFCGKENKKK